MFRPTTKALVCYIFLPPNQNPSFDIKLTFYSKKLSYLVSCSFLILLPYHQSLLGIAELSWQILNKGGKKKPKKHKNIYCFFSGSQCFSYRWNSSLYKASARMAGFPSIRIFLFFTAVRGLFFGGKFLQKISWWNASNIFSLVFRSAKRRKFLRRNEPLSVAFELTWSICCRKRYISQLKMVAFVAEIITQVEVGNIYNNLLHENPKSRLQNLW